MIKDIGQKQDEIELAEIASIKMMDEKALALYKQAPEKVPALLTTYCETQANQVVQEWWKLAWSLVARYDDGYINAPQKMAQEVGYPKEWYGNTNWSSGPTSYNKPENHSAHTQ